MAVLNIYHPDIKKFYTAKSHDSKTLEHFNLSVMVDDKFMTAVKNDQPIYLHFPVYDDNGRIIEDQSKWQIKEEVSAKELWNEIMRYAYDNGEPGVFFYDNLNKVNNLKYWETIIATNPCSEYLSGMVHHGELSAKEYGGACNLGSLILPNFVINPFTSRAYIDLPEIKHVINIAVRFLDNIIDKNYYPDKVYENFQKEFRTIGLGVTGLADMLAMINLRYDSEVGRYVVDVLMEEIAKYAFQASIELAKEKGAFPAMENSVDGKQTFIESQYFNNQNDFFDWEKIQSAIHTYGIRNGKLLSIAPTGTMSMVFGNNCSSGIEPIFALSARRKIKINGQSDDDTQEFILRNNAYGQYLDLKNKGEDLSVTDDIFGCTATNISPDAHLEMLAVIAKHVDMSVSKTINIPTDYSFEQTKNVYTKVHELGIKGCTIFRPNALRPGIMSEEKATKEEEKTMTQKPAQPKTPPKPTDERPIMFDSISPISRKTLGTTHGDIFCRKCACGTLYITVAKDDHGNLVETFVESSKGGVCKANTAAVNRMVSLAMRSGVKIDEIIDQLKGIDCKACTMLKAKGNQIDGLSCPDIIASVIKEYYDTQKNGTSSSVEKEAIVPKEEKKVEPPKEGEIIGEPCPSCGASIVHEGGCVICLECGWSKCG